MAKISDLTSTTVAPDASIIPISDGLLTKKITVADLKKSIVPQASSTVSGTVKVGAGLRINDLGVLSVANFSAYVLPPASASTLGGIRIGSGLAIDDTSVVSLDYNLPTATTNVLGGVKVGDGLAISDGVLSVNIDVDSFGDTGITIGDDSDIRIFVNGGTTPTIRDDVNGVLDLGVVDNSIAGGYAKVQLISQARATTLGDSTSAALIPPPNGQDMNLGISSLPWTRVYGDTFYGNLQGNVTGDVTGNVTGDVTGNITGNVTGNVTGNADTVTNGVYSTQTYNDPAWIGTLAGSKITGTVANATLAASVTDGVYTTGSYSNPSWITALTGDKIFGAVALATGATIAQSAVKLSTARTINGVEFDGTQDIEIASAATADLAGSIKMWGGATAPAGWQICNGSEVSRAAYPRLFQRIGTTYGAGNGNTTFNLPNFVNRFGVGAGGLYSRGSVGGSKDAVVVSHTHSISDPGHDHSMSTITRTIFDFTGGGQGYGQDTPSGTGPSVPINSNTTGISINNTGVSGVNANMPPYLAALWIIKMDDDGIGGGTLQAGDGISLETTGPYTIITSTAAGLLESYVPKSGTTMSGYLTLHAAPVNANHAATKNYVDTKVPALTYTYGNTIYSTASYTNQVGSFNNNANYFDVFPPSGKTLANLVAFIPSIAVIHYAGGVDGNDSLRCTWSNLGDRIRVYVQNTEQRSAPAANYLAIWS